VETEERKQPVLLALALVLGGAAVVLVAGALAGVWWYNHDLLEKERTLHRIAIERAQTVDEAVTEAVTEAVAGAEGLPDTAEPWVADYAAGHADDLEQVTVALDEAGERRCLGRDDDLLLGRLGVGDAIEVLCDDLTPQMYGEDVVSIVVRDRRTWCEGEEELTVEWYSVVEPMRDSLTAYLEAHPELCAGDLS